MTVTFQMVLPVLLVALSQLLISFPSSLCEEQRQEAELRDLYLMGLLPVGGTAWPVGRNLLVAMEMALDVVNNRTDVLAGYRLHLVVADTAVSKLVRLLSDTVQLRCNYS